jgi:hypothetical protein
VASGLLDRSRSGAGAGIRLCVAWADCTNPDLLCDPDRVAEAALSAYAIDLDRYRP